jgi:ribosome-binding factor A
MIKQQTQRQQRASSVIHRALVEIFGHKKMLDERLLNNSITITNVTMSSDLKIAYCNVVPFGAFTKEDMLSALKASSSSIRKQLASKIEMKFAPEVKFFYDDSYEQIQAIESLFNNITYSEENI